MGTGNSELSKAEQIPQETEYWPGRAVPARPLTNSEMTASAGGLYR